LRTLAAAPTNTSAEPTGAIETPSDLAPPAAPPARVEPERLAIGSGYVGSI
jgi:hypothetical protein